MLILSYARVAARTGLNIEYDTNTEDGVAASDVAGRLIMSVEQFEKTSLEGTTIKNQVDLNRFIEEASTEKKATLGRELGIAEEEWSTLQLDRFNGAIRAYRESGRADAYKSKIEAVNKAKSVPEAEAKKKIPSAITLGDGKVQRYKTDKVDIAVYREGENYVVYDYNEKTPSRMLSRSEVNSVLEQLKSADGAADVAKTLKTAENTALTNTDQGNVSVSGGKSLSPSARMAKDVAVVERAETIDLTNDSELAAKVNNLHGAEKYKIIQQYILGILGGQEVRLSDGKNAIVDKSDALHIANMSGNKKTAQIAKIKELVEKARLCAEDKNPIHNKFNYFCYYEATVRYAGKEFPVYLNVGKAINDGSYHIYDITERIRDTANRINGLERPKPNEGYALKNDVSSISIPDSAKKSNSFEQNSQENAEKSADFGKNAASAENSSEKTGANTESSSEKSSKEKISELKEKLDVKNIEAYCRENIEDYAGLSAANQSMIRQVVREGRAYGLDDADVLSYARVAARSGLNIEYDASLDTSSTASGPPSPTGEGSVAGYYDPENNRIVVNPRAEKKQELILTHELDHAVRKFLKLDGGVHTLVYIGAEQRLSGETWKQIQNDYADQDVDVTREELLADEASAYYTEAILGPTVTVDMLLGKEPSLAKKILNFFTGAARAYSKDAKLSKEARRHYKNFKKLFDSFAERNKGRNAETATSGDSVYKSVRRAYADITWRNVDYDDSETKAKITADLHKKMVEDGLIVKIPDETTSKVKESYPNLQGMKKKERLPILKESIKQLKNDLRAFLTQLKDNTFEFEVAGDVLEAKLYNVGIDEVLEKVTQDKAEMLYTTEEIFRNSKYLYSTPDYDGDPNIYRWNYFYTPVQIGENVVGVRIAIRDMMNPQESQIYNWGIKKDTSLDGTGRGTDDRSSHGISSDVSSNPSISQSAEKSTDSAKKVSENSDKISKSARKSGDFEAKVAEESGIEKSIGKLGDGKVESVAGRDAKAQGSLKIV